MVGTIWLFYEAGQLYLVEDNQLRFKYTNNFMNFMIFFLYEHKCCRQANQDLNGYQQKFLDLFLYFGQNQQLYSTHNLYSHSNQFLLLQCQGDAKINFFFMLYKKKYFFQSIILY